MTQVTCRLTAKNWDQLRNPMLGNWVWATFTFNSASWEQLRSVANWQFRHINGSHIVVGRSLSPVRRHGTRCRNVYTTLPTVLLAVFSKHFSSHSTIVYSALEASARMRCINWRFTLHYITSLQTDNNTSTLSHHPFAGRMPIQHSHSTEGKL